MERAARRDDIPHKILIKSRKRKVTEMTMPIE